MYKIDDIGSTFFSLPPNLQNIENECFTYAFDRQMVKLKRLSDMLTIWSNPDKIPTQYYDYAAINLNIPYYRSEYTDEQKLKLIKSAMESLKYAGTRRAIDTLTQSIFNEADFLPWYEYENGKPYHFKIRTDELLTEDITEKFLSVVERVKAARSILDAIEIRRQIDSQVNVGMGMNLIKVPPAIREQYIPLKRDTTEQVNIGIGGAGVRIPPAIMEMEVIENANI